MPRHPTHTIKICGLSTIQTLEAAIEAGADLVGLVFFPRSPRHVGLEQARGLADRARGRAAIVALSVDADDDTLAAIAAAVRPDVWQLHGRETPARALAIRERFGGSLLKAVGVATRADMEAARPYAAAAIPLLFDAKPPKDAALPGGNGAVFDWSIVADLDPPLSFMLSGGLDPSNVAEAIRLVRPAGVDVSSGVESAPGVKDIDRINAFVANAREGFSSLGDAAA